jgi:RNA polymerase sigma-70 factor (ECF subfamily)
MLPTQMSPNELNDLFASCMPGLRRVTQRMLRNPQDSEDALQEGLLLAVRKLRQFEGRSSFSTWLHAIVRNTSRMHYRKNANSPESKMTSLRGDGLEPSEEEFILDRRPSPETVAIHEERSQILRAMTRELPARYQTAILHFYLRGLGEREAAKRMGVTESSLKARLHRSRRILIQKIHKMYLPDMRSSSFEAASSRRENLSQRHTRRIRNSPWHR